MDNPVVSKVEVEVSRVWELPTGRWVKVPIDVLSSFIPYACEDVKACGYGPLSVEWIKSQTEMWNLARESGYIVIGRFSSSSVFAGEYYVSAALNLSSCEVKLKPGLPQRTTATWQISNMPESSVVQLHAGDLMSFMGGVSGRWIGGEEFNLKTATYAIADLIYGRDLDRAIPSSSEVEWLPGCGVGRDQEIYLIKFNNGSFAIELVRKNESAKSPLASSGTQFYFDKGLLVRRRYNGGATVAQPINQDSVKEDNMALSTQDQQEIAKVVAAAMAAATPAAQPKGPSVVGTMVKKSAGGLLGAIGYMTWQPWKKMAGPVWQATRYTFAVSTLVAALTVAYLKGPALFAPSKDEPKAESKDAPAQVEKTYTAAEVAELMKSLGK